jgi:hypothetical protein
MDKQRLMEQELNQLRAGRDQHQQVLSSAEERTQKQVLLSDHALSRLVTDTRNPPPRQTEQLREELIELRDQCADLKQYVAHSV